MTIATPANTMNPVATPLPLVGRLCAAAVEEGITNPFQDWKECCVKNSRPQPILVGPATGPSSESDECGAPTLVRR
jgi:hypothetical protein